MAVVSLVFLFFLKPCFFGSFGLLLKIYFVEIQFVFSKGDSLRSRKVDISFLLLCVDKMWFFTVAGFIRFDKTTSFSDALHCCCDHSRRSS